MSQSDRELGRSAALMSAGTGVSRLLGFVRIAALAGAIGVNVGVANSFTVANTLPNVLYMLIAGGVLNAVLVPQVVRAYRTESGQEYVDRLLTLGGVLLLGATVLLTAAAPLLIRLYLPGGVGAQITLATAFALWCIPQVFFYGVYSLLGQVLNARGSFGPFMWAPVVNNVVAIAGIGVFVAVYGSYDVATGGDYAVWDAGRVALLAGTATLGVIAQAAVLVVPLRRIGFRYRPRRGWRSVGLGSAGRVAGWTLAALGVGQVAVLAVQRVAGTAAQLSGDSPAVPGNTAYQTSFLLFMLPHSLVTVSLVTALFTRLSTHAAADDTTGVRRDLSYGLRTVGVFTVFATAVLMVLALPLVRLVLPSALPVETGSIAPVVALLALGLVGIGAWSLVQRVYYAYEEARSLFWVQVAMAGVVVVVSVLGALTLPYAWWLPVAGAAIGVQYLIGAGWGVLALRRRLGGTGAGVLRTHGFALSAALASAAVGWPVSRLFGDLTRVSFGGAVVVCVVVGTVMLVVYVALLRLLKVTELDDLLSPLLRRVPGPLGRSMGGDRPVRGAHDGPSGQRGDRTDVAVNRGMLLAGRYRLDRQVETDLPGVQTWEAADQILDRPVRAVVLREGRVRQAQDAARRAALVSDPRLLRVLDVGDHDGLPYVVTEPVVGRDLAALTVAGPLPADQARAIIGEAAVALEVARRRGVHHLALRPSAVVVRPDGSVVVTGLALDGELAGHGLGDARSTTRADTVGLVALLYLLLTGRWPAPAGVTTTGCAAPLVQGPVLPPGDLVARVPNDLDTLCAVTLGPHDDGPHSPAELVRELEPWGPVLAAEMFAELDAAASRAPVGAAEEPAVAQAADDDDARGVAGDAEAVAEAEADSEAVSVAVAEADSVAVAEADSEAVDDDVVADEPVADDQDEAEDGATQERPPVPVPSPTLVLDDGVVLTATAARSEPATVQRQSVRESVAQVPAAAPPGTPPPAIPPTVHRPDPRTGAGAGVSGAAALPGAPQHPQTQHPHAQHPHAHQHAPEDHRDFDSLIGRSAEALTRTRFDPTPVVLALVAIAVVVGLVMAWNALTRPAPPIGGSDGFGDVSEVEPTETGPAEPGDAGSGAGDPAAVPVIASAVMVDPPPGGDENEHPELVPLAIDGDPATVWYSRTYRSPTYGMKPGIGYAVTLAAPATVTTVTLQVRGSGGMVEVRATDPSTPTEGEVLASGPLAPTTVLTLAAPTEATSIVLWFTALPQTDDGSNRVELAEVSLS